MPLWLSIILVIVLVALIILAILYFWGSKMQRRQVEQQTLMDQNSQTVSMLIIDKKLMKMKDSGLPAAVIQATPWYAKRAKVPVVKAKVGNRIAIMVADNNVFPVLPVKCEAKVVISGIYIREVKSVRGQSIQAPPQKKGPIASLRRRLSRSAYATTTERSVKSSGKGGAKNATQTTTAKGKKKK